MLPSIKQTPNPNGLLEDTLFIPAFLEDNQVGINRDPDYEARLMARDPQIAEALRWGNWSVFSGQFIRNFSRSRHVVKPFELPLDWLRWRSLDWGFAAPLSCHWWAMNPDSRRIYVYRELYQPGLTDPQQARKLNDLTAPGEVIAFTWADPSMWNKKTDTEIARSSYDVYLDNGVLLTKAVNDRQQGISKIRSALANLADGLPAMQIFDSCTALIRTFMSLVSDPKNPEDILDGQEDHAFDDCRYGLSNWTPPAPPLPAREKPKRLYPMQGRKGF